MTDACHGSSPITTATASDFELHAYLDGELAADRIAAVEARLLVDVDARILLKSLAVQRRALDQYFALPHSSPKTHELIERVLSWPDPEIEA